MATHQPVHVPDLLGELMSYGDSLPWTVVHTKPRSEKKLAEYAQRNGISYYLPQYTSTGIYQRRKVTFSKVMFPGYLFMPIDIFARQTLTLSGWVVGYIKVTAQKQLLDELQWIYHTQHGNAEIKPSYWLGKGLLVEITSGPLKGVQGIVESHDKLAEVRLQVNILRQAVLVSVDPKHVKIMGNFQVVETGQ